MRRETGNPTRKLVLLLLADAANGDGVSWNSQERIATFAEVTKRTVRNHLKALEDQGLVQRVERRRVDGSRASDEYRLSFAPAMSLEDRKAVLDKEERATLRGELLDVHGPVCWYCGRYGDRRQDPDGAYWHLDRMIPGHQGGEYIRDNLALSCASCNRKKGRRRPGEWKDNGEPFSYPPPWSPPEKYSSPVEASFHGGRKPASTLTTGPTDSTSPTDPSFEPNTDPGRAPDLFSEADEKSVQLPPIEQRLWEAWLDAFQNGGPEPTLTEKRKQKLRALYDEQLSRPENDDPLEAFEAILEAVQESDHHMSKRAYQFPESLFVSPERRERWYIEAMSNGSGRKKRDDDNGLMPVAISGLTGWEGCDPDTAFRDQGDDYGGGDDRDDRIDDTLPAASS